MYVWRIPILAFADIVIVVALVVVLSIVLRVRTAARNPVGRGLLAGLTVVALAASPLGVQVLTSRRLRFAAAHGLYIDPSALVFLAPAAVAITIVVLASVLFPAMRSGR